MQQHPWHSPLSPQVCVWDWRFGHLLTRLSLGGELAAATFTEDSSSFVVVGKGFYKVRPRAACSVWSRRSGELE
jgi:hypothetical protein